MKPTKEYKGRSHIRMFNADCMDFMEDCDKYDLAIVDPPYGINMSNEMYKRGQSCQKNGYKEHKDKNWDIAVPDQFYFKALFDSSKNQIVWGANYYTKHLKHSMGWVVWNKVQRGFSFADAELAWSSFNKAIKVFDYGRGNESGFSPKLLDHQKGYSNIHPTQKPIQLYKWLLTNYANEGDTILDTHGGSMSIAIACWDLGFDLDIIELDEDYFNDAVKRFEQHISQTQLF